MMQKESLQKCRDFHIDKGKILQHNSMWVILVEAIVLTTQLLSASRLSSLWYSAALEDCTYVKNTCGIASSNPLMLQAFFCFQALCPCPLRMLSLCFLLFTCSMSHWLLPPPPSPCHKSVSASFFSELL